MNVHRVVIALLAALLLAVLVAPVALAQGPLPPVQGYVDPRVGTCPGCGYTGTGWAYDSRQLMPKDIADLMGLPEPYIDQYYCKNCGTRASGWRVFPSTTSQFFDPQTYAAAQWEMEGIVNYTEVASDYYGCRSSYDKLPWWNRPLWGEFVQQCVRDQNATSGGIGCPSLHGEGWTLPEDTVDTTTGAVCRAGQWVGGSTAVPAQTPAAVPAAQAPAQAPATTGGSGASCGVWAHGSPNGQQYCCNGQWQWGPCR